MKDNSLVEESVSIKETNINLKKDLKKSRQKIVVLASFLLLLTLSSIYLIIDNFEKNNLLKFYKTDETRSLLDNYFKDEDTFFNTETKSDALSDREALLKFNTVISHIKNNYYQEKTTAEIIEKFLEVGLENMGNRFTKYLNQETFKQFLDSIKGSYYGIGVTLSSGSEVARVISNTDYTGFEIIKVASKSPANRAGLRPGDFIIGVDGRDASFFKSLKDLAETVRGEIDTQVKLKIYRPSLEKVLEVDVLRGEVEQTIVEHKFIDDVAYLRINSFTENLPSQFLQALREIKEKNINKIIFDLRFNGGGDAEALKEVLDYLLPYGPIAHIRGRENGQEYEIDWETSDSQFFDYPVSYAALVNRHTASASEFFVGALRDRLNMPVFGETTFGKGVATSTLPLADNTALLITTFEYILPKGEKLDAKGLNPTHPIQTEEAEIMDLSLILPEKDEVLKAALNYFKDKK